MPRTKQSSKTRRAIAWQRKARWRQQVASGGQQSAQQAIGLQFINYALNVGAAGGSRAGRAGKNDDSAAPFVRKLTKQGMRLGATMLILQQQRAAQPAWRGMLQARSLARTTKPA